MPLASEFTPAKAAHGLQVAAIAGAPQTSPFTRDLPRAPLPFFSKTLPPSATQALEEVKRLHFYPDGSIIFHQGQPAHGVFIIKRGTVKLSMTSSKGRSVILRVASEGEFLGLSSVMSGESFIATAETLEETEIAYVEREQFLQILAHCPEAAIAIAMHACANYRMACRQIGLLGLCRSASERLAQFLLNWAAPKTYRDGSPVWLGLTHEEISQAAGTTRETVTRTLMDFRKKGWAHVAASSLTVHNREALEKLVTQ